MSAAPKINTSHPFMDREVVMSFGNGVIEVLKMMADVEAHFEKPFAAMNWQSPTEVSVHLTLSSDPYKGKIQFHFDKAIAKSIIEKMTGAGIEPDSPEILDGVGEISNMFYGAAKTKLNLQGYNLNMSLPKPCWTKDLPKPIATLTCMVIPFKISTALCYVEIIIFS